MLTNLLKKIAFVTAVMAFAFSSCKKSNQTKTNPDDGDYHVNFTVDGVAHSVNKNVLPSLAVFDGESYSVGAVSGLSNNQTESEADKGIAVILVTNQLLNLNKIYNFFATDDKNYIYITYNDGSTGYSSNNIFAGSQGSLKVTQVSPTFIRATFSAKIFNASGTQSVTITNGDFYIGLTFTTPYPKN